MAVDPHILGSFRMGYTRLGVMDPDFDGWTAQEHTVTITLRRRSLAATSDLYTAHPNITWTTSTAQAIVHMGVTGQQLLDLGVVGSVDGVVWMVTPFNLLDRFDYKGCRYEVNTPPVEVRGRRSGLLYRKAGFRRVELEDL